MLLSKHKYLFVHFFNETLWYNKNNQNNAVKKNKLFSTTALICRQMRVQSKVQHTMRKDGSHSSDPRWKKKHRWMYLDEGSHEETKSWVSETKGKWRQPRVGWMQYWQTEEDSRGHEVLQVKGTSACWGHSNWNAVNRGHESASLNSPRVVKTTSKTTWLTEKSNIWNKGTQMAHFLANPC